MPQNKEGTSVEAKQAWVEIGIEPEGPMTWISRVKDLLGCESDKVRRLINSRARLMAAVFVIPRIAKDATWAGPLADRFCEQVRTLVAQTGGDVALAWYEAQDGKGPFDSASQMRYPGVLFFGRFLPEEV
jgi:hypothetical protein